MGVRGGGDSFKPGAFRHNGAAALALLPLLALQVLALQLLLCHQLCQLA